ncbi:EF hand [Dictyocaulus viviparus]|uniref:EF hand n=1 Tax=Dictyocaulus viviparus TaxID=29172 RepID=A0A0D8YAH0_DICVI|nr:EF hand [Dictyocaulus viviparus]
MNKEWKELNSILNEFADHLEQAKVEAEKAGRDAEQLIAWLDDIESLLATKRPVGGLPESAQAQLNDFLLLKENVIIQNTLSLEAYIEDVDNKVCDIESSTDSWIGRNQTFIKNKWIKVKKLCADREKKLQLALEEAVALDVSMHDTAEWLTVAEKRLAEMKLCADREKKLQLALEEAVALAVSMHDTAEWLTVAEKRLAEMDPISHLPDVLETQLREDEKWTEEVALRIFLIRRKRLMAEQQAAGTRLQYYCEKKDSVPIKNGLVSLKHRFEKVSNRTADRTKQIQAEMSSRQRDFDLTYKRGLILIDHAPRSETKQITQCNNDAKKRWTEVLEKTNEKYIATEKALLDSSAFDEAIKELELWIDNELEKSASADSRVAGDVDFVRMLSDEHKKRDVEWCAKEIALQTILSKADQLSAKVSDEKNNIEASCNRVMEKWSRLKELSSVYSIALRDAATKAADFDAQIHGILDWLVEIESRLAVSSMDLTKALCVVEDLKVPFSTDSFSSLQLSYIVLVFSKADFRNNREKRDSCIQTGKEIQANCCPLAEQTLRHWIRVVDSRWKKREELNKILSQQLPSKLDMISEMQQSHNDFYSKLREKQALIDDIIKNSRRGKKNAAAVKLCEDWKQLWLDSIGYQAALEGQRQMLEEMCRLEGWRWEVWKEQYVEWNDHRKARVSDLFRRIDRNHTGNIPRETFIDGILTSKFPSSRLELNKVADLFDKGDGLINSKEFIDALRFDRFHERKPLTEHEKVNEEIAKQKNACSCCQQYKIEKVADGHYRFGDTQIKRMVRILRSTVMVRVGGGWEPLDIFLSKHDPCRTRGRLNIDMFYKDVAPSNAIDTMRAFTRGRPRSVPCSSGPVVKVREKTERSIPMFPHRRDLNKNDASELEHSIIKESEGSPTASISRPLSRNTDSAIDDKPTRIPSIRKKD